MQYAFHGGMCAISGGTHAMRQWTLCVNGCYASMDATRQWMLRVNGCYASMDATRQWMLRVNGCTRACWINARRKRLRETPDAFQLERILLFIYYFINDAAP